MLIHDAASAFVALIDTAVATVQVLAGLAAIVLCALPLCNAPGIRALRGRARRPMWARGRLRAAFLARTRVRRSHGRLWPRPARVPRVGTPATRLSRTLNRPHSASQTPDGAFPAPPTPRSSQGRTRRVPAWAHTEPYHYDEAA